MAYLDDRIIDHPKLIDLTDESFRVWVHGLCYCSKHATSGRLEGFLKAHRVRKRNLVELEKRGLWDREEDGSLWVHDWHELNEKRQTKADERRAQAAERQRRHRERARAGRAEVTRDVTQTSRVTVTRDSERDSNAPGHAQARARARVGATSVHDQITSSTSGGTVGGDDAGQVLERLRAAGWTPPQLKQAEPELERALAWIDHATSNPKTRNAGGLAWSGFASNVWPPDHRSDVAAGAAGERSTTTVHPHVCPHCGPPGYPTETQLVDHLENVHHDTSRRNGDHADEPVVDLDLPTDVTKDV